MPLLLPKPLKTELLFFIGFYALVCLFILSYSPTVMLYVGHDMAPVLDGAWRLENGQVPHKDFPSILGHGYLLQQQFFLHLFSYNFIAFAVSSIALTTLALSIFLSFYWQQSFVNATNRLVRVYLFLLLLSLGLGQYHFGVGHTLVTYANLYNRYCFLVLVVLLLQVLLLADVRTVNAKIIIRLAVAGILLSYLLFVKLTYFAVALALLSICTVLSLVPFAVYWRLLAVSILLCGLIAWTIKFDFAAMLADYQTISAARGSELIRPGFLRYKLLQYYNLAFLAGLALLLFHLWRQKAPWNLLALLGFTGVCALGLQFTNWGATDIVLLCFIPAVFVLYHQYTTLLSYKLFLLLCCFFLFKNVRSIYYLSKAKENTYTELKSPYLSGFYTNFTEIACKEDYATRVMSGVQLVNKAKTSGDKVFAFAFDNPFPFLTQTPPPKAVPTVWQYATTYTDKVYTPADQLFGDVGLLLVPTCLKAESATEMMKLYGSTVAAQFSVIDSNRYWRLYRKRKPL